MNQGSRRAGVVLLLALAGGVLAGSATAPSAGPAPPPSADDVRLALQALREAGTGRYEARIVRTLPAGTDTNVLTGEYDLRRSISHERLEGRSSREPEVLTVEVVRTTTAWYSRSAAWVTEHGDTWKFRAVGPPPPGLSARLDYDAAAMSSELMVLLSFRVPDGPTDVRREGDTWVVRGTVAAGHAMTAFSIYVPNGQVDLPATGGGLSAAHLILGPDEQVRELRLDGLAFALDYTVPVPAERYESLRATTSTIRFTDLGAPVTIRTPPPDRLVREPGP
jgi:hypothetical protein